MIPALTRVDEIDCSENRVVLGDQAMIPALTRVDEMEVITDLQQLVEEKAVFTDPTLRVCKSMSLITTLPRTVNESMSLITTPSQKSHSACAIDSAHKADRFKSDCPSARGDERVVFGDQAMSPALTRVDEMEVIPDLQQLVEEKAVFPDPTLRVCESMSLITTPPRTVNESMSLITTPSQNSHSAARSTAPAKPTD